MSETKPPADTPKEDDLSLGAYLVLGAIALPVLLGTLWLAGLFEPSPPPKRNEELARRMDELGEKLRDPRVRACWQAAWTMGETYRREGRRKPSDVELHAIALKACDKFKVPRDMRGVAVDKFKSGFGWGWSQGL